MSTHDASKTCERRPHESPQAGQPGRATYRHGDLRAALLAAGIALARDGGPQAVVLRETTRRAGVVPNAAYRHFANRDALLQAVRAAALASLARAMEDELAQTSSHATPAERARAGLRAIGIAYLRFARQETGLFRTAFTVPGSPPDAPAPEETGKDGLGPFQLLGAALDRMQATGALDAAQRTGAEYFAWSVVHGLAMLLIEGPLQGLPETEATALGERLVAMVERAL